MRPASIRSRDWWHYNALFLAEHVLGIERLEEWLGSQRRSLFARIRADLDAAGGPPPIRPVEELPHDLDAQQFLDRCYKPILPKVFRGAAASWPAVQRWSPELFEQKYGDRKIILTDNRGLSDQQFEVLEFREYIRQFRTGSRKYLRFSDVVNDEETLRNDFDREWLMRLRPPKASGEDLKMFMGAGGTLTPVHVGFSGFLFVQVMGRKHWILYPPNQRIFLDPRTERTLYFYSDVDPHRTNEDSRFPLAAYAERYEIDLDPGDVLWVPPFTWHQVENLSDSIGIRCGCTSVSAASYSSRVLTALIFLATRPSLLQQAYHSRRQKNRVYVFTRSQSELVRPWWQRLRAGNH